MNEKYKDENGYCSNFIIFLMVFMCSEQNWAEAVNHVIPTLSFFLFSSLD